MDYGGNYPGRVKLTTCLKENNVTASERREFTTNYYRGVLDEGKANNLRDYTRDELLPLLIVRDERGTG